jgi:hypothetical protein
MEEQEKIHVWEKKRKNWFFHNFLISFISSKLCNFILYPIHFLDKKSYSLKNLRELSFLNKKGKIYYRSTFFYIRLQLPIKDSIRSNIFLRNTDKYENYIKSYPLFAFYNFTSGFITAIIFGIFSYQYGFMKPEFTYFTATLSSDNFIRSVEDSFNKYDKSFRIKILKLILPQAVLFRTMNFGLFDSLKGKLMNEYSSIFTILFASFSTTILSILVTIPWYDFKKTKNLPVDFSLVNEFIHFNSNQSQTPLKMINYMSVFRNVLMLTAYETIKKYRNIEFYEYNF